MAKTRKASKKEKKRIGFRDVIMGCVAIIIVLLVTGSPCLADTAAGRTKGSPEKTPLVTAIAARAFRNGSYTSP